MSNIQKCLRSLSNAELHNLTEVMYHIALSEEVTRRFKQRYEELAYDYYNGTDYAAIGNMTELGVEDHGIMVYKELTAELVPHISSLV